MTMFLKYLRHKVDSVKCFTLNFEGDQIIGQIKAFHALNSLQIHDGLWKINVNCILKLKA